MEITQTLTAKPNYYYEIVITAENYCWVTSTYINIIMGECDEGKTNSTLLYTYSDYALCPTEFRANNCSCLVLEQFVWKIYCK